VSPDFEAEVAFKILNHPSLIDYDVYLISARNFRDRFRTQPDLLISAYKQLLSQGRIEKNSDISKKWEASISEFKKDQRRREKGNKDLQIDEKTIKNQNENNPHLTKFTEMSKPILKWLIIFIIFSTFIIAVIFYNKR
jgi:hypothetical protein